MFSGDQEKPFSKWNWGPETEARPKNLYHGMGLRPPQVFTGNPVSWLISESHDFDAEPYIHLTTAQAHNPLDRNVKQEVSGYGYAPVAPHLDATPQPFTQLRQGKKRMAQEQGRAQQLRSNRSRPHVLVAGIEPGTPWHLSEGE